MQQVARIQGLAAIEAENGARKRRASVRLASGTPLDHVRRPRVELRTQKASAVLSYLALTEAKQESRERLVGLLWSRSDEERAGPRCARSFANCALRSRTRIWRVLGGQTVVHPDPAKVEVDVETHRRLAESGSVDPLLLNTPDFGERILEGMGRPRPVIPDLGSGEAPDRQWTG